MAIQLDKPTANTRPPVVSPRGLGQKVVGMIVDKEVRERRDRDGMPILNAAGKPSNEEVLTVLILDGTTGVVSGGDLGDDWTPEPGSVARIIIRGLTYRKLIDARRVVGGTQVGDVITVTCRTATIWRGKADIAQSNVDDDTIIRKARDKGLRIGWDLDITYGRAVAEELALVAKAEKLHTETRARIQLDVDDAF